MFFVSVQETKSGIVLSGGKSRAGLLFVVRNIVVGEVVCFIAEVEIIF